MDKNLLFHLILGVQQAVVLGWRKALPGSEHFNRFYAGPWLQLSCQIISPGQQEVVFGERQPVIRLDTGEQPGSFERQTSQHVPVEISSQYVVQVKALRKSPPGQIGAEGGQEDVPDPEPIRLEVAQVASQESLPFSRMSWLRGQVWVKNQRSLPGRQRAGIEREGKEVRSLTFLPRKDLDVGCCIPQKKSALLN